MHFLANVLSQSHYLFPQVFLKMIEWLRLNVWLRGSTNYQESCQGVMRSITSEFLKRMLGSTAPCAGLGVAVLVPTV